MTDQLVEPTRRSARVAKLRLMNHPTAKHTRPSGQDTPLNPLSKPSGFAASSPHESTRPNQRSTRGERSIGPTLGGDVPKVIDEPTAVHVRLRGHETSRRLFSCGSAEFGVGVDWTCQPVPSQRSASGRERAPDTLPTAVQASSPEQETASSEPPGTSGLGWIDQLVPSQRSMSGLGIPNPFGTFVGSVLQ